MTMTAAPESRTDAETQLQATVAVCHHDPRRFVRTFFPWGHPGPREAYTGPDTWQDEFLCELGEGIRARKFDGSTQVAAQRFAVSSGHGTGKSTMAGFLTAFIMSTRPHAQGTVTANTNTQLRNKTWASIRKWMALCSTAHWFEINTERMQHLRHPSTWFCATQSCAEGNSEAFAGQHEQTSTSFYIFDEASAVPDSIYEVAEGGLTDGVPMIFLFGNPTRSSGMFHQVCFGSKRNRWDSVVVDSRESAFTNKAQIQEWAERVQGSLSAVRFDLNRLERMSGIKVLIRWVKWTSRLGQLVQLVRQLGHREECDP